MTDKYIGDLSTPMRPPHTPLEDIKFITLLRVRIIENVPYFNTLRLESFPQERWEQWWNRHQHGELDEPFEVFKTKESYNHQELYEFKQKLAKIYQDKETIEERNVAFQELLDEVAEKIEFIRE